MLGHIKSCYDQVSGGITKLGGLLESDIELSFKVELNRKRNCFLFQASRLGFHRAQYNAKKLS